jgi:pectin methylesterase-like acyl-CoA thioesterase
MRTLLWQVAVSAALAAGLSIVAQARTLCVNPAGTSGCYSTINAAVGAASDHDTIKVKAGTYAEYVVVGKSVDHRGRPQEHHH